MRYLADWMMQLAYAAGQSLRLMLVAFVIALVFGAVLVLMRRSRIRMLSGIAAIYITAIRGTPVLAQLFFIYFGLAEMGVVLSSWQAAMIGLGGNSAAYVAEIYRAGFESVSHGQIEAARSMGLRRFQTTRLIVVPQMVTVVLPPLANQAVVLIKETSVASLIAAPELMLAAKDLASEFYMPLEIYLLAGLMYLVLAFPMSLIARWMEARLRVER
jgi:His/Glu/Gln/Arg/opine family amino acid ABC transporter permease subunit